MGHRALLLAPQDTSYEGPGGEPGGITSPVILQLDQAYTFEFWLCHDPAATDTVEHLSSDMAGTHTASPMQIVLSIVNGDPETLAFFPWTVPSLWPRTVSRGRCYHVVFTFDPTVDTVELFLDGISQGRKPTRAGSANRVRTRSAKSFRATTSGGGWMRTPFTTTS